MRKEQKGVYIDTSAKLVGWIMLVLSEIWGSSQGVCVNDEVASGLVTVIDLLHLANVKVSTQFKTFGLPEYWPHSISISGVLSSALLMVQNTELDWLPLINISPSLKLAFSTLQSVESGWIFLTDISHELNLKLSSLKSTVSAWSHLAHISQSLISGLSTL